MRIAVFTDTYYPQVNGVSKYLEEMQKYMDNQNIEYKLFVPRKAASTEINNVTSFYGIPFALYPELRISWPRYSRVKSALEQFSPDLIYLATPISIGTAGLKYARKNNIPIVSTYHTNFPQYLSYYHLDSLQGALWQYLRWFHSFSRINFCPSLETVEQLQDHGIGNLMLCNNGIDCTSFSPDLSQEKLRAQLAPGGEILLLYVGRVAPEKDLDILIGAVERLNHSEPALPAFKLLVVGDGPSRKAWQEQELKNIIFTGYKTGHELQTIYASSDIFAFPSRTETFGNVILEAMASGLPVVASYAGGIKESLVDGYNGLAFAPGDAKAMADSILQLLVDAKLRQNLAENARKFALERTWDIIFARFFASCCQKIPEIRMPAEAACLSI
ncbi:MAG: glycosyltransferase family 1 protein [Syntrophomonadaceae bacterium]|nr:glycosyltransferase family 1 protein [Syntrophomonadaceae bacterium]